MHQERIRETMCESCGFSKYCLKSEIVVNLASIPSPINPVATLFPINIWFYCAVEKLLLPFLKNFLIVVECYKLLQVSYFLAL